MRSDGQRVSGACNQSSTPARYLQTQYAVGDSAFCQSNSTFPYRPVSRKRAKTRIRMDHNSRRIVAPDHAPGGLLVERWHFPGCVNVLERNAVKLR